MTPSGPLDIYEKSYEPECRHTDSPMSLPPLKPLPI